MRAFDHGGALHASEVVDGEHIEGWLETQFADPQVCDVHVHFARAGCFACRVERV